MSFASQVKQELNAISIKSNCCKKAYLFGACLAADKIDGNIRIRLSDLSTVNEILFLLKVIYKIVPERNEIKKGCFSCTELTFDSKRLAEFMEWADSFDSESTDLSPYIPCPQCTSAFLRSVFCVCGSVSDPQKSYTLEMRPSNDKRADLICRIAEMHGIIPPCRTQRKGAIGLFYRNESAISDFLTACGVNKSLFEFFDIFVKKNLRNIENRATNCVAKNISKAVDASTLQIQAIEALMDRGMFDEIAPQIKRTALLRIDNPGMSLVELAALHDPPISKSGLNHRLEKLIDQAKKYKLI